MAHEQSKSDPFLANVEAKIAAWTAVRDSYKAAVALDAPLGDAVSGGGLVGNGIRGREPVQPGDLPVGVFRDKTIKEAIEIYLRAGNRKQTNKEIALGLQKGGIATLSTNFEATVATQLGRMRDEGTILRFQDGWDLASSYPDSLRGRLSKDAKPRRSATSRGKRQAKRGAASKAAGNEDRDKTQEILNFIQQRPGVTLGDIDAAAKVMNLNVSRDYLRVVIKRLIKRGHIKLVQDLYVPVA
jgi:hypothetical protein